MAGPEPDGASPLLRVVAGAPDAAELAAVTVAILALLRGRAESAARPAPARPAGWRRPAGYRPPGAWSSR
ncbi:acyl-CoA carboxylase epsilon subunit [Actinomadura macrotermitis]|uniref:Acyl-CoA carboxylase subunit epsilon n=1 Tax=Actinomadura macrotermitis TaxID=2585200 RepID=A0A7K0C8N1_9ACTN|nr:acyl-CoA carboxylase epsilon subunit [Actinomadura macrotermitis]MQY09716.1 hypothetical protein [Actinomadura macrotermitis]